MDRERILYWLGLYNQTDGTISGKHNKSTRVVIEKNSDMYTTSSPTHNMFITELDHSTGTINKIKYAPLWEKYSKTTGNNYFTGDDSTRIKIVVHVNKDKTEDKHPDWIVFKAEKSSRE